MELLILIRTSKLKCLKLKMSLLNIVYKIKDYILKICVKYYLLYRKKYCEK